MTDTRKPIKPVRPRLRPAVWDWRLLLRIFPVIALSFRVFDPQRGPAVTTPACSGDRVPHTDKAVAAQAGA